MRTLRLSVQTFAKCSRTYIYFSCFQIYPEDKSFSYDHAYVSYILEIETCLCTMITNSAVQYELKGQNVAAF